MSIELKVNGVVVYSDSTVTPPVIQPPSLPPPPVTPPVYGSGNIFWDMHETQLWPVPPMIGSDISISFVADATRYPKGVSLALIDESQPTKGKYLVISEKPHDFTPINNHAVMDGTGSYGGPLYLRFGPAEPRFFFGIDLGSLDVPLTPGRTYYINFKGSDNGPVSAQFVVYARGD